MFNKLRGMILSVGLVSLFFIEKANATATSTSINVNIDSLRKSTEDASYLLQLAVFQRESIYQLASLNATYLAIAVSILALGAGVFYLFNFKPLSEKIQNQEKNLVNMKKENEDEFTSLKNSFINDRDSLKNEIEGANNDLKKLVQDETSNLRGELSQIITKTESRVKEIEREAREEIKDLKVKAQELALDQLWDQHYLWQAKEIPVNEFRTLSYLLEETVKYEGTKALYSQGYVNLACKSLLVLMKDEESMKDITERAKETVIDLIKTLSEIEFSNENKDEVLAKLKLIKD